MIAKICLYIAICFSLTNCTLVLLPIVAASNKVQEVRQKQKWSGDYYTAAWVTDDAGGIYHNHKFKVTNKKELAEWEDYARRGQIGPIIYHPKK